MTLKDLKVGGSAVIRSVGGAGALRQHLLDMGVLPGSYVQVTKMAPMGDPMQIRIHDYELTLRLADAQNIEIETISDTQMQQHNEAKLPPEEKFTGSVQQHYLHPGLGEAGKYHDKTTEHPLPDGTLLTFALAGNQNSGKTTLFNQLTGSNQHVGNFPGVTVDRKDGVIRGHSDTLVTDLPGIYSMSPYTSEEIVTRQFILDEKPKGIINIVDATNIERNLYLTLQLMELNVPMVIALNMMDEVRENGGSVHINKLEKELGLPVVPISAAKDEGIEELIEHSLHVAKYQEPPERQDFCDENDHGGAVHRAIHAIMVLIQDHCERSGLPIRFAATKVIEGDSRVLDRLELDQNEKEMIEHIIVQMEKERGLDRNAAIADMRYSFIHRVCVKSVVKPHESREHKQSAAIDRILTGKYTGIPCFIGIMAVVFLLTFNVIGAFLQNLLAQGVDAISTAVSQAMQSAHVNTVLQSLVVDGIINGVGSVISFLPIIVVLFFFLSILEDSGYMARIAFVMDKPLRKIGLSGRSMVPMLIGFGCTVPAVMSSRTLPSERDRKMTIMMTPFMSCSAKVPIYAFFVSVFFPGGGGFVMTGLYVLGIALGILYAYINRKFIYKGEAVPFVMELPNYRLPSLRNVLILMWEKAKDFLQRAFTIIMLGTIVIWFLQTFGTDFSVVADSKDSILAVAAGWITPIFKPIGLGDWRIVTALIAGFMAKESVVSITSILYGSTSALLAALSPLNAFCMLVFCLLYTPCIAAISSIHKELGWKYGVGVVVFQCAVAWVVALAVRGIGLALGFA
ncbi:MAG: ferrous iron transport protein B [Lachnospiraceae bacterium]|jgi:ferrous iron transport protein B